MKFYFDHTGKRLEIKVERNQVLIVCYSEEDFSFGAVIDYKTEDLKSEVEKFLQKRKIYPFSQYQWKGCKIIGAMTVMRSLDPIMKDLNTLILKKVERSNQFYALYTPLYGELKVQKLSQEKKFYPLKRKIKVMVIDDSPTVIKLLSRMIQKNDDLELVASTTNPLEAKDLIQEHHPDVLTLDIHMPHINGLELLKQLYPVFHIPTIMISSITPEEGPLVLETLEHGAFDYLEKPQIGNFALTSQQFNEKIMSAYQSKSIVSTSRKKTKSFFTDLDKGFIFIGSSTGGTNALRQVLTGLPDEIPPILITQHIPPVFSKALAVHLNKFCHFEVKEAEHDEIIKPNHVYIAPGGQHLGIKGESQLKIDLSDDQPINHFRPSVDYMFSHAASLLPRFKVVSAILTGMGSDGAEGMLKLHRAGAVTLAQDEASSVIFGMPKEAIERGGVQKIVPLGEISEQLVSSYNTSLRFKKSS